LFRREVPEFAETTNTPAAQNRKTSTRSKNPSFCALEVEILAPRDCLYDPAVIVKHILAVPDCRRRGMPLDEEQQDVNHEEQADARESMRFGCVFEFAEKVYPICIPS
jgi:hypothetical protein